MAFCINCGQDLADGAKFCANCGKAVDGNSSNNQRKTTYDGEIHKCPNCGDIIDAYESVCEACGYEIRDRKASNSIRELAAKIQEIEKTRVRTSQNPLKTLYFGQSTTDTDKKIVSLVSSFPIPNSKEDLYEFIVLSYSNINADVYDTGGNQFKENDARLAISNAWKAKLEQAYQKAKIVFAGDPRLGDIQTMYDTVHKSINKAKWKTWKFVGLLYAIIIGFLAIVFIIVFATSSSSEKKEIARLEAIVEKIEIALDEGDYKYALMNVDNLHYTKSDTDLEKEWEIKRDYYIDKVIEEAAKDGIILEEPVHEEETSTQSEADTPSDYSGGFIDGFKDGVQSGLDSAKENIDEFNNIMNGGSSTISKETLEQFINGYDEAVFDDYNSPASENGLGDSRIYIYCMFDKTEILEADGTTSILGYVTDETDNEWLIQLHFVPAVSKTAFDTYVGQELILRGVYSGFSEAKKMPVVVLDEMIVLATGENVVGMQKLLDE